MHLLVTGVKRCIVIFIAWIAKALQNWIFITVWNTCTRLKGGGVVGAVRQGDASDSSTDTTVACDGSCSHGGCAATKHGSLLFFRRQTQHAVFADHCLFKQQIRQCACTQSTAHLSCQVAEAHLVRRIHPAKPFSRNALEVCAHIAVFHLYFVG